MEGRARSCLPGPALDQRTAARTPALARPATAGGARSPAAVLALQRTAGNAAVVRSLGLHRRPAVNERLLQRAPIHLVMPLRHNFFYGQNNLHGYTVKPAVNPGIPAGYHVTIYPELSQDQQIGALQDLTLGQLPGCQSIEFTLFNVTREANRTHYYFNDQGNVVYNPTKTAASLIDAHWDEAIQAALPIYRGIGVTVTAQQLYDQLHHRGRTAPVSAADTFGRVQPTAQPVSTRSALSFVPRQLRGGKGAATPRPVAQPAPAMAPPQPFMQQPAPQPQPFIQPPPAQPFVQQPFVQQPPAQPERNPFPLQPFVRAGRAPPQPLAQPAPFMAPPQPSDPLWFWPSRPFVPPPPAQPYGQPAHFGGDPLAYLPVFEHEDEMQMDVDMDTSGWQG